MGSGAIGLAQMDGYEVARFACIFNLRTAALPPATSASSSARSSKDSVTRYRMFITALDHLDAPVSSA
jgi:hypothetical protein